MSEGPLATREVRWFLPGGAEAHPNLSGWLVGGTSVPRAAAVPPAEWRDRLDGQPDIYLMLPGSNDMGIKWREGLLQIKGRVAHGVQRTFGERHHGNVECWLKWSYGGLPDAYRHLFSAIDSGLRTIAVRKRRMLRLFRICDDGTAEECDPDVCVARGVSIEIADVEALGERFTTLGFEAFPDDTIVARHFASIVSRLLIALQEPRLDAANSQSYPAWLARFPD